jgi:hypothetical protein
MCQIAQQSDGLEPMRQIEVIEADESNFVAAEVVEGTKHLNVPVRVVLKFQRFVSHGMNRAPIGWTRRCISAGWRHRLDYPSFCRLRQVHCIRRSVVKRGGFRIR